MSRGISRERIRTGLLPWVLLAVRLVSAGLGWLSATFWPRVLGFAWWTPTDWFCFPPRATVPRPRAFAVFFDEGIFPDKSGDPIEPARGVVPLLLGVRVFRRGEDVRRGDSPRALRVEDRCETLGEGARLVTRPEEIVGKKSQLDSYNIIYIYNNQMYLVSD